MSNTDDWAMRVEGDFCNAYFAKLDTIDHTVLIGSLQD
jgi:hypothetical protein